MNEQIFMTSFFPNSEQYYEYCMEMIGRSWNLITKFEFAAHAIYLSVKSHPADV